MKKIFIGFLVVIILFVPTIRRASAQSAQDPEYNNAEAQDTSDIVATVRAKVISVETEPSENVPGEGLVPLDTPVQDITAVILNGPGAGETITLTNTYTPLKKGEKFYAAHYLNQVEGMDAYQVTDVYRLPVLFVLMALFLVCVVLFGGVQGIRGLVSLLGSLVLIFALLLPGVLHGISPLFLALFVSLIIVTVGSYITHGFNKTTSSAVIGMICTVVFVGVLAWVSVHAAHLTGIATEENSYLNINTNGIINFPQLILGGIMIGLLGVLYDVAIGQAVSVEELHRIAPHISRLIIYKRAIRIGHEHVGALVNVLAIAYVGVSFPLLLYYLESNSGFLLTINKEVFATEIIRTLVGSIGLILAVPITTFISTTMLVHPKEVVDKKVLEKENHAMENLVHHH